MNTEAPAGHGPNLFSADPAALLEGLNEPQREAVMHGEGPMLVLAGAGSGKTRVLTHRIAHLVASGLAHPSEILAITFTNKAAKEMRERVENLVGGVSRLMWVMTFHAACARLLRAEAERIGYKRAFTIYDEADSMRLLKGCMDELGIDPKRFTPRSIRHQISAAKNRLQSPDDVANGQGSIFEENVADAYDLYEQRLQESNAMDFDDLLVRTVHLLEQNEDVRERYARTFRWVLVDEYQDTNRAQYRMLQLLAGEHRNLTVVGDDAQSIYGWRQADIRNILDFEREFPDAKVIRLEQNYRSTETVLAAANAIIANNREQKPKRLWSDLGEGEPVKIVEVDDEHGEARFVTGEIERLLTDEQMSRDQIAVFYRVNAQSRVLEDTLVRFDVPYQVIGGTRFYDRAEIKDIVGYLSLLANPADVVSFQRVVNSPRRGIGNTSQGRILAYANSTGEDILDLSLTPDLVPGLGAAAVKSIRRFGQVMDGLRDRVAEAPVAEILEAVIEESGYRDSLEAERTIEAQGRLENLAELVGVAREFDTNRELEGDDAGEMSPLEEFLAQISLLSAQDNLAEDESRLLTLMTLHNAKGLEYDAVFIIGMEEGVFPHMRAMDEGNIEEERRLCYVGVTRARQRLYLTRARSRSLYGGGSYNLPSRFLAEIPETLVKHEGRASRTGWRQDGLGQSGGFGRPASGGGYRAPAPRQPQPASASFNVGDDVVHASFGDGVVTGLEPGPIVVVRFRDGGEKKLMADYAPLKLSG